MFKNEKGTILQVAHHLDHESYPIGHNVKDGLFSEFDVVYADEMEAEPKKGDFNDHFGMHIERPFFVVSALSSERYLDILGRNMVIKTPNGRTSQQWYFDQKSRTIKSMYRKNWSWDIAGSGKSNNMHAWNTNSKWW